MGFFRLSCLALLACLALSSTAQAATYAPDLVCYVKDSLGNDLCAPNEYVKECNTHPMTHLSYVSGAIMCVDNSPIIPPPLLDAWYPPYVDPYTAAYCIVPNTFIYAGPIPVGVGNCVSTATTPQDDSVGWFCADNANYFPEWGPQGYKCVLRQPTPCPGIPPYHLEAVPGYPHAFQCIPNQPPMPTCSSTETLTLVLTDPNTGTNQYTCIQTWPWTAATVPPAPSCPTGEVLISNGKVPPNDRYGCELDTVCPANQTMQVTSPPGAVPVTSSCQPIPTPSCATPGEVPLPDPMDSPVTYHCCPQGYTLNANHAVIPTTYTCMPPPTIPAPPTCPSGQSPVLDPAAPPYYICSPPAGAPCPSGQNRQSGTCVANSGHAPTCSPTQTPTLVTPTSTSYTCVANPTCPIGSTPNITNYNPLTYTCVASPTGPTCPAGQHLQDVSTPPAAPNIICVADDPNAPPVCPGGQTVYIVSMGPPINYGCQVVPAVPSCPTGQYATITSYSPLTYACSNGGN